MVKAAGLAVSAAPGGGNSRVPARPWARSHREREVDGEHDGRSSVAVGARVRLVLLEHDLAGRETHPDDRASAPSAESGSLDVAVAAAPEASSRSVTLGRRQPLFPREASPGSRMVPGSSTRYADGALSAANLALEPGFMRPGRAAR